MHTWPKLVSEWAIDWLIDWFGLLVHAGMQPMWRYGQWRIGLKRIIRQCWLFFAVSTMQMQLSARMFFMHLKQSRKKKVRATNNGRCELDQARDSVRCRCISSPSSQPRGGDFSICFHCHSCQNVGKCLFFLFFFKKIFRISILFYELLFSLGYDVKLTTHTRSWSRSRIIH
jgi:hypothetical protein